MLFFYKRLMPNRFFGHLWLPANQICQKPSKVIANVGPYLNAILNLRLKVDLQELEVDKSTLSYLSSRFPISLILCYIQILLLYINFLINLSSSWNVLTLLNRTSIDCCQFLFCSSRILPVHFLFSFFFFLFFGPFFFFCQEEQLVQFLPWRADVSTRLNVYTSSQPLQPSNRVRQFFLGRLQRASGVSLYSGRSQPSGPLPPEIYQLPMHLT